MINRKARRQMEKVGKAHRKPKYSLEDVQRATNIALEMKKLTKGHLFSKTLKERCIFCGATLKTRTECKFWFFTFMDRQQTILINPGFFTDNEVQALWVRNEDEYKEVQFPLNMHLR